MSQLRPCALLEEGIVLFFETDGGGGTMPWVHHHFVGEGE